MERIFRLYVNASLPSFSVRNYRVDHVRAVGKVTVCGRLLLSLQVKTVFLEAQCSRALERGYDGWKAIFLALLHEEMPLRVD